MLPTYKMNKPCESRLKRSESAYLKEYFDHLETSKKSSAFVEVLSKEKEKKKQEEMNNLNCSKCNGRKNLINGGHNGTCGCYN